MRRNLLILAFAMTSACTGKPMPANGADEASASAAPAAASSVREPTAVVEHHVEAMKAGDMDAIMSDYADDAVVISPPGLVPDQTPPTGPGVFSGKSDARRVFTVLTNKDNITAVKSMVTSVEAHGKDVAFLYWTQFKGTPQEVTGRDIFVIRNGKVVFQDIIPDRK